MLGLPDTITACLFDLDGVLTQTAKVHNAAWTQVFNEVLKERADHEGTPYQPFDPAADYNTYVDGKPRADGVRDFLTSRDITLPDGSPDDPPDQPYDQLTVNGVGNRKNVVLLQRIRDDGVQPYEGSVRYLKAVRDAGLRRVVVSASANCKDVLAAAGLTDLLEERVDGVTLTEKHLRGKPAPDGFLEGASTVHTDPAHCAVFEDALSGVAAGKAGNFGFVVGVNRVDQRQGLLDHGATVVVDDLADLLSSANGDPQ